MLYRTPFLRPRVHEFTSLQRALHGLFEPSLLAGLPPSATPPAVQVHSHADHVALTLPVAGLEPASIEVSLDQGLLSISGERPTDASYEQADVTVHVQERFAGRFHRRLQLPEDIDPQGITARYAEGVLHITAQRRAAPVPRRIVVQ